MSLTGDVLQRLTAALTLGPDERMVLYAQAYGGVAPLEPIVEGTDERALRELIRLVEIPEKLPHYLTDHAWNILAYNPMMLDWFPWVGGPSANLMRWALTSPEARTQLVDWHRNAEVYLGQLRYALSGLLNDLALRELQDEVLSVPACREIWDEDMCVVAYRQGHRFRLDLPRIRPERFTVSSHVLLPAYLPGIRHVTLMPTED